MNGGVLHAAGTRSSDELQRAIRGYRYLGLDGAADVVEWVQYEAAGLDMESDEDLADRLEAEADDRYAAAIPDATIVDSFEDLLRRKPDAFASL